MPDYPTTAVPFADMPLHELRDPVVTGSGPGGVTTAAESYRQLGDLLRAASEELRVAMARAREAHEGGAAELAEQHVSRVVAVGELGAGQAQITAVALQDGAGFYARVRDDMNALPPVEPADSLREASRVQRDLTANRELAVEAAQRYERNANWTLGRRFQLYEAPVVDPPGTSVAGAAGGPGGAPGTGGGFGGSGGGAAVAAGGSSGGPGVVGAAGVPSGVPPAPLVGGSGVGGSGVGGPGVGGPGSGGPATGGGSGPSGSGGSVSRVPGDTRVGAPAAGVTGPAAGGAGRAGNGAGRPASLGPASGAPGRYRGADPAAPPLPGWQPGRPWSSRTAPDPAGTGARAGTGGTGPGAHGGRGAAGGRAAGDPHAVSGGRPSGAPGSPAPGGAPGNGAIRGAPGSTGSGVPFLPGGTGGAGRGQDGVHPRPPWLVEDDPQAFWFSGLPEHGPGVIGGESDSEH